MNDLAENINYLLLPAQVHGLASYLEKKKNYICYGADATTTTAGQGQGHDRSSTPRQRRRRQERRPVGLNCRDVTGDRVTGGPSLPSIPCLPGSLLFHLFSLLFSAAFRSPFLSSSAITSLLQPRHDATLVGSFTGPLSFILPSLSLLPFPLTPLSYLPTHLSSYLLVPPGFAREGPRVVHLPSLTEAQRYARATLIYILPSPSLLQPFLPYLLYLFPLSSNPLTSPPPFFLCCPRSLTLSSSTLPAFR